MLTAKTPWRTSKGALPGIIHSTECAASISNDSGYLAMELTRQPDADV